MIIEEEFSSCTYANWVFLRQRSRSNHIELKLHAAIKLVVSTFVLRAPSMHWRCTEDKAKYASVKLHAYIYSKTSNNGPSEKRTTSLQRTAHLPPIDFTIELIHFEPPRSGHLSTPNNGH